MPDQTTGARSGPVPRARGAPLSDVDRERIAELAGQGWSRNAIARELNCSTSTVTAHARRLGVSFDRSATEQATAARVTDAAARRAELAAGLLSDALAARGRLAGAADARGFVDTARAVRELITGHLRLDEHDRRDPAVELSSFDRWLDGLSGEPDPETAAFLAGAAEGYGAALDAGPEDASHVT